MARVLLDRIIRTEDGQFDLIWGGEGFDGAFERFFAGQVNGLVGAADPGGIYINLARRSGGSAVVIRVNGTAPALSGPDWQDVVEVSAEIPSRSRPGWSSWAGETSGELDLAPGRYRVRVSASGRDAGAVGELADGVVDRYQIDFWPAPAQKDEIIRVGSEDAAYWHAEIGTPR